MNPLLASIAIVGVMAGATVCGAGFWVWNGLIDNPALIRIERARCAAEVEAAAAKATRDEQIRQMRIGELATAQAAAEEQQDRQQQDASSSTLARENADYAQQRNDRGPSCSLDGRDIAYLERLSDQRSTH